MLECDRLIELLKSAVDGRRNVSPRQMANHLLDNGVIVPPCKVGDTVYYINTVPHIALYQNTIYKAEVVRIVTTRLGTSLVIQIHNHYGCTEIPDIKDFGKTVFLNYEDAEKALKEVQNNDR